LAGVGRDARQAVRVLVRSPGYVLTVVCSLGVGMVVSIVVFSLVNAIMYGDIPGVADRRTLARLFISHRAEVGLDGGRAARSPASPMSRSDFDVLAATPQPSVSSLAAEGDVPVAAAIDDRSTGTTAVFVSAEYFATLRTPAFMGRVLSPADDRPGAPLAVVIGYHLWRDRFDALADIVGKPIRVSGQAATIVGVAPPRFTGIQPSDIGSAPLEYAQLWLPLGHAHRFAAAPSSDAGWLTVVGRLSAGATLDRVRVDSRLAAARVAAARPAERHEAEFVVRALGFGPNDTSADILIVIALFLSVPLSILAIGCANTANLQLGRAWARSRELATRMALGASRAEMVRVLAVEAFVVTLIAGFVAWIGASAAVVFIQPAFPLAIVMETRVFAFVLTLVAGVTLASGAAPAWLSVRRVAASQFREAAHGGGVMHARLRHALVVAQIALSLALLVFAGLSVQSVRAVIGSVPAALREIAVTRLDLGQIGGSPADARELHDAVMARLRSDARVRSAALERLNGWRYRAPGDAAGRDEFILGGEITDGWFDTMDARLVAGRRFERGEAVDAALINERLAREVASGEPGQAVGRTIRVRSGDEAWRTVQVIGVLANIRPGPAGGAPHRALYVPMPDDPPTAVTLLVRSAGPTALAPDLRRLLADLAPELPVGAIQTADTIYLRDTSQFMFMALTVGGLGTIALLLAGSGLLAVMAYSVSLRTREIGIRMAIGARPIDVTRLIMRQSTALAAGGVAVGLGLAIPLAVFLRALFAGVSPLDPIAVATPCLVLFVVSVLAAALPARRAAHVDPATTLRDG
jgi:predicted permease